jgi:hypothetical protein
MVVSCNLGQDHVAVDAKNRIKRDAAENMYRMLVVPVYDVHLAIATVRASAGELINAATCFPKSMILNTDEDHN